MVGDGGDKEGRAQNDKLSRKVIKILTKPEMSLAGALLSGF
jgi:hypothetical protein